MTLLFTIHWSLYCILQYVLYYKWTPCQLRISKFPHTQRLGNDCSALVDTGQCFISSRDDGNSSGWWQSGFLCILHPVSLSPHKHISQLVKKPWIPKSHRPPKRADKDGLALHEVDFVTTSWVIRDIALSQPLVLMTFWSCPTETTMQHWQSIGIIGSLNRLFYVVDTSVQCAQNVNTWYFYVIY